MNPLAYIWKRRVVGAFLTGLFVLLPIVVTIIIIEWVVTRLSDALGPGSFLGELLTSGGSTVIGPGHHMLAFWIGSAFAIIGVWALGVLVRAQARRQIANWIDDTLSRVPLFRTIYRPVSQVVRRLNADGTDEFKGMQVVMCRFGGEEGAEVLALLTAPDVYEVAGRRRQLVYLPTSPLPMTGGLVFVAEDAVTPVPGMDADDLIRIYFSLGALMPEHGDGGLPRLPKVVVDRDAV